MPPKKKSPAASPASPVTAQPPHEAIAVRAYEFFVQRGYTHGRDLQDWLQAERELLTEESDLHVPAAKSVRRKKSATSTAAAS